MVKHEDDDLIIGVFANYGLEYPGIEQYMVSIERSGFVGHKVLLVWNLRSDIQNMLLRHGWELISVPPPPRETKALPVNFFIHRIKVVAEYLKANFFRYRDVFWLDIKDLVVQTDPSDWMQRNRKGAAIIASTECVTLAQEETNDLWIKDVCGLEVHEWLKDEEVVNGGTFAGEAGIMTDVFCRVYDFIKNYDGHFPACQPAINYVLRQSGIKDQVRIPRWTEGFAACLHPMWAVGRPSNPRDLVRPYLRDVPPALDIKKRLLYPREKSNPTSLSVLYASKWGQGTTFTFAPTYKARTGIELIEANLTDVPFSIVHGWDRDWNMKHFFCEAYSLPRLSALTTVYRDYKNFLEKGSI